jgi:DNA-binding response OmpR family regulator
MSEAKILIVDDEEEIRELLERFLSERFACEIKQAANGREAIKLLKEIGFDLILLDIKMPGLSGVEVIREAKKTSAQTKILVLTKYDSQEVADKVITEGAAEYIPKPFSLKVVGEKVRGILEEKGKCPPKQP